MKTSANARGWTQFGLSMLLLFQWVAAAGSSDGDVRTMANDPILALLAIVPLLYFAVRGVAAYRRGEFPRAARAFTTGAIVAGALNACALLAFAVLGGLN